MFSRVLARRPKSSLRRCLISFWCARENINIKPKRTLAGFARSFLTVAEAKNNKYCARTVRSRENEAFGWSRQCSVWLFDDLLWEVVVVVGGAPPLAADLDCGYYICMMCVRKHSAGGTFKPEQHAVFGCDNILWLTRFTCLPCYWSSESPSGLAARNRRVTLRFERFFVLYIVHG